MELIGATKMAEEPSEKEKEEMAEESDAEKGNCGELAPAKEDLGGKASDTGEKEDLGGKSSESGGDLDGDESEPKSEQALPPPVVRDGRRYLSIQR